MVQASERAAIGRRTNALMRAGFYSRDEVQWLAEYVQREDASLDEIDYLLTNAEYLAGRCA